MNYLNNGDVIELTKRIRAEKIEELEFGEMQELLDAQVAYHDDAKHLWYWEPGTKFRVEQVSYFDPSDPESYDFYVKLINPDYFYGHIEGYMQFDPGSIKLVSGTPMVHGFGDE